MKIYKISKNISSMLDEELIKKIEQDPPLPETYNIAQEIYKRKNLALAEWVITHSSFINDPSIANLVIKVIAMNSNDPDAPMSLKLLLENTSFANNAPVVEDLTRLCLSNPKMTAIALLDFNTPETTTLRLLELNNIQSPLVTNLSNSPILQQMINYLDNGLTWGNYLSSRTFCGRLTIQSTDSFIIEASKYDLSPPVAEVFKEASESLPPFSDLRTNLNSNFNPGPILAKMVRGEIEDPEQGIQEFIKILTNYKGEDIISYYDWIWKFLSNRMAMNMSWAIVAFIKTYNGKNILDMFLSEDCPMNKKEIINFLIDIILKYQKNYMGFKGSVVYQGLIEAALEKPSLQSKIFQLPEYFFKNVPLPTNKLLLVEKHFHPVEEKVEYEEEIEDLLAQKYNWFKKYAMARKILKKAGYENEIAVFIAVAMILLGITTTDIVFGKGKNLGLEEIEVDKLRQNKPLQEWVQKNTSIVDEVQRILNEHPAETNPPLEKVLEKPLKTNIQKETLMPPQTQKNQKTLINPTPDPSDNEIFNFIVRNECLTENGKPDGKPILNYKAYPDPSGKNMAIGVAFNLNRPFAKGLIEKMGLNYQEVYNGRQTLTRPQIIKLFEFDLDIAKKIVKKFTKNYNYLPANLKIILIDMAYSMGENGMNEFNKLKNALNKGDLKTALVEIQDSNWMKEDIGRNRVANINDKIESLEKPSA